MSRSQSPAVSAQLATTEADAVGETSATQDATDDAEAQPIPEAGPEEGEEQTEKAPKRKRERKEPVLLTREEGKSLLPISRVQKIIKADRDIPIVAKDATFLISLATEEFIKRLTDAAQRVAYREKRTMLQHRDIATVVKKADEFAFLEELFVWISRAEQANAKRKPKALAEREEALAGGAKPTLLDQYVVSKKDGAPQDTPPPEIVMNEDGTIAYAGDAGED